MTTAEDTCRSIVDAVEITRTKDHDACITYCTILDVHLENALEFRHVDQNTILQTLANILDDTQNEYLLEAIGWDVVMTLRPYLGQKATNKDARKVLDILVTKGNAKEVFLKCVEGLNSIVWERTYDDNDNIDNGEATLTEKLAKITTDEKDVKVDEVLQTLELYRAVTRVFKRIKTDRPARFLTTFAAALLTNVTSAFQSLVDSEQLDVLHNLVLDFITSNKQESHDPEKGEDIDELLKGALTTYVPVFLGNNMLFWTGQYWEGSHNIPSGRVKSKDLANEGLETGLRRLLDLASEVGMTASQLFDYAISSPPDDIDLETSYPEGDSFIPIDAVGSLLLFASTYSHDPNVINKTLAAYSHTDLLSMHRYLVDAYLDEANLNVVDAIILLGMMIAQRLLAEDFPSFTSPQDPAPSEFLECLQRMAAMAATCPSENLRPLIYSLVEQLLNKCSSEGRLFYILDTLDHCPYDNLKVAVIGTLKKQISKDEPDSLFSSPELLTDIGPRVFRLPEDVLADEELAWDKVTFIIEALSLYRLLLLRPTDSIGVKNAVQITQTHTAWLNPLRKSFETWVKAATLTSKDSEEDEEKLLMGRIVIENLDRIDEVAKSITGS